MSSWSVRSEQSIKMKCVDLISERTWRTMGAPVMSFYSKHILKGWDHEDKSKRQV
jgi:hypothetical protein